MTRKPFPLQWPEGWSRTKPWGRSRSKFEPHFVTDRDDVLHWLAKRGSHVVITSELPLRNDGLPYYASVGDPGIAVWWVERGQERVLACDRWSRADENMRAISKTLEALRGLTRWGAHEMVERAYAGFAALPGAGETATGSGPPEPPRKLGWRELFGVQALFETLIGSSTDDLLAVVKARHRKLIAEAHPDAGGDVARAAELNAALDEAEKELGAP